MYAEDLDPNYLLPLWQALVRYFRAFPPLVQAEFNPPAHTPGHPSGKAVSGSWWAQTTHHS